MKYILPLLLILILIGCVQTTPVHETLPESYTPKDTRGHAIFQQWADAHNKTQEEATTFFQEVLGIENEDEIFEKIPPIPKQFEQWKKIWEGSDANTMTQIPEDVYRQPEFYPTFNQTGVSKWVNATSSQSAFGLMSIPAEQETTISNEETEFEATLFVGSAWGTTYFQGMGFRHALIPEAPHTIEITPDNILVGPTFPQIDQEWVHRVTIRGTITPQEGINEYALHLYPDTPDPDDEQQWYAQHAPYLRADTTFINPEGLATLTIRVQEE